MLLIEDGRREDVVWRGLLKPLGARITIIYVCLHSAVYEMPR